MFLADYHLHSSWSHDSNTTMREIAETAVKKNLSEICFTDHFELNGLPKIEYSEYVKEFYKIQKEFKNKIDIKLGVELGITNDKVLQFSEFVNSFEFDYVLASTHRVDYISCLWPEFWHGITKFQGYSKYFEYMYKSIKKYDNFDCWGHLDFVVRYGDFKNKGFKYSEFGDILDEILKIIIHKGKGIEINTSLKNKGFDEFHPNKEILARYIELGGEILTVGSDSHSTKFIGSHIKEAYALMENLGLKYVSSFSKRKAVFHKLSDF